MQPKCKKIFKIVCHTLQTCDLVSHKKSLRLGFSTSIINNFSIFSIFQTQQQGGAVKYSGPVDVAKSLYREGGMRSIYKGTVATLLRGKNDLTSQH